MTSNTRLADAAREGRRNYAAWHMDELSDWIRANGIDPNVVPLDATPTIANGQITITVYRLNDDRRKYLDDNGDIASETITVPLVVAPTGPASVWCGTTSVAPVAFSD